MIGNLGTKFGSLFLLPLYTKYLSTSEYGVADLSITFINLFLPIITMSIFEMFMKDVIQQPERKIYFLKNAWFLLLCTNVSAWIIGQGLYALGYIHLDYSIFLLMMLLMTLQSYNSLFSNYLRAINKNTIYATMNLIQTVLLIIFAIMMLRYLELGLPGYFYANVGAYTVVLLVVMPLILFRKKDVEKQTALFAVDFDYLKQLVKKVFH